MSGANASPIGRSHQDDERSECKPDRQPSSSEIAGTHRSTCHDDEAEKQDPMNNPSKEAYRKCRASARVIKRLANGDDETQQHPYCRGEKNDPTDDGDNT